MLDFHKIEGAPEILEGNEFKLNWTKAELTLYLEILILTSLDMGGGQTSPSDFQNSSIFKNSPIFKKSFHIDSV